MRGLRNRSEQQVLPDLQRLVDGEPVIAGELVGGVGVEIPPGGLDPLVHLSEVHGLRSAE